MDSLMFRCDMYSCIVERAYVCMQRITFADQKMYIFTLYVYVYVYRELRR